MTVIFPDTNISPKHFADAPADALLVRTMFPTLQGEGPFAGRPAIFIRLGGCNLGAKDVGAPGCAWCFPESYPIKTVNRGLVRFRDVVPGDVLLSLDRNHGLTTTTVKRVLSRQVPNTEMVSLYLRRPGYHEPGKERFRVTADHPFEVKGRGFVSAGELRPGDVVFHVPGREIHAFNKRVNNPMAKPASVKRMLTTKDYQQSKMETELEAVLATAYEGIRWVGNDPNFIIGDDKIGYKCPDFAVEGTNKLIEVYVRDGRESLGKNIKPGWSGHGSETEYKRAREKHYQRFGYAVLFMAYEDAWTHPGSGRGLRSPDPLLKAVGDFIHNGATVTQVIYGGAGSGVTRDGYTTVVNFSCEPYNTFLFRGLHTHNCDTDFRIAQSTHMTTDEILTKTRELIKQCPFSLAREWLIVVTGGEPMLQRNLIAFCEKAAEQYTVQIETNGMYHLRLPDETIVVMSPKVGGAKETKYPKPNPAMLSRADHLKFVLSVDPDSAYREIPDYAWKFPRPVWVSPMAVYKRPMSAEEGERASAWDPTLIDQEATARNYEYCSSYALKHGLRVSIQQHLFYNMP